MKIKFENLINRINTRLPKHTQFECLGFADPHADPCSSDSWGSDGFARYSNGRQTLMFYLDGTLATVTRENDSGMDHAAYDLTEPGAYGGLHNFLNDYLAPRT